MYSKTLPSSFQISKLLNLRFYSQGKSLFDVLANMPKTKVSEGIKKSTSVFPPARVYLQVVGSGARGAPNSLYLFTDHNR